MRILRSAITFGIFPITFVAAQWVAATALERGVGPGTILGAISVVTALIIIVCERLNPQWPRWNKSQRDVGTDVMHAAISMMLIPEVLKAALTATLLTAAAWLSGRVGFALWPTHWPIWAQVIPAMLISQFGEYWWHRMLHEIPLLWRLHATHHSPGRLYWLNAARFHPLDTAAGYVVVLVPLLLLGAQPELMLPVSVWVSVHGMFQHCNIRLRLGPLNYIFSMAELHRWHHSLVLEEANANYGNNILFWDLVFGTVHYPKDREASPDIGLADLPNFPTDYVGQLLSPFRWKRLTGGKGDA